MEPWTSVQLESQTIGTVTALSVSLPALWRWSPPNRWSRSAPRGQAGAEGGQELAASGHLILIRSIVAVLEAAVAPIRWR